ncbi:hypothetical protein PVAND_014284 [Polypedilum vanderplanki]|uniref:Uncharacterized protein n=1 Tax=Polypedilum vanderplanki TaxID=319348 RepID=A0A9J6CTM0_POLVA|nr:hypothetical protein PVAND_014284 [Polypedilum vanderplanki]
MILHNLLYILLLATNLKGQQQWTTIQHIQPQQLNGQYNQHHQSNQQVNNNQRHHSQQWNSQNQHQQETNQYKSWQAAREQVIEAEKRLIQHQQALAGNNNQNTNKLQSNFNQNYQQTNPHLVQQTPINNDEQQYDSIGRNIPQSTINNNRRPEVTNQGNEDAFKRRKSEPWEGEGDIEYTKSQEAELINPIIGWKIKNKKWQVPYKMDKNIRWTTDDLNYIKKNLQLASKKMKINFKERDYETYYLVISSMRQCIAYSLKQYQPIYKEIYICLDYTIEPYNEIFRATQIGYQVNERINKNDTSEEEHEESEEDNESDDEETDEEDSNEEHDDSY